MERKRLFINKKTDARQRLEIVKWAAANNYEAVVFPLGGNFSGRSECIKLAKRYDLFVEAGGGDLSLLLPRRLFFFRRDLFRMELGRRKLRSHFCPTNPAATAIITESAKKLFAGSMQAVTPPRVFHLLPDEGRESAWCACPACRAFSPAEQYMIAVNTAADALAAIDPEARLSFLDFSAQGEAGSEQAQTGISPRGNMFKLKDFKPEGSPP